MRNLLHERVSARAETSAGELALAMHDERMTYAELEAGAGRFANALEAVGGRPGDRVCLIVPKSPAAVVAMLGTLKAGCVYVPVDSSSPVARAGKIVAAADPSVVAVTAATAPLLDALVETGALPEDVRCIALDDATRGERFGVSLDSRDLPELPEVARTIDVADDAAAHILFTSGSTGVPKGVEITHANVCAFLDWAVPFFGIAPGDRVSGHAPLYFDLSTFDVYGALSAGAELHLVPPESSLLPGDLAALIEREQLVQWFSVPSVLTYMANFGAVVEGAFQSLRRVIWCGDALPTPVLVHWMKRIPHASYTNLYGPTETTIASSFHVVEEVPEDETAPIPIGRACAGEELLVLDEALRPVRPGRVGNLYVGGVGLSPGYWRDPEQTAAAFVADPRSPDSGRRLYRTGDLARVDELGTVYFLGRVDSQIKSRGHRIELGEVEAAVNAAGLVRESAVVGVDSGDFAGTAICCAVAHDDEGVVRELRAALRQTLPSYMVPSQWLVLPALPQNGNGKTDRLRLRELFRDRRQTPARKAPETAETS
jgi:amino acid adenylation domain-containing protein